MNPNIFSVKLSFVVAIYNMELYLQDCLEGILRQNIDAIEIILVDDGSTDNSLMICKKYEKKYEIIKVIHKEMNEGISSARNMGMSIASGEYICFLDSDDFYKIDFASSFLELCYEYHLDIIRGWYSIYDEDNNQYLSHEFPNISYRNKVMRGDEFLEKSIREHANEVVPWLGFFRREYLLKYSLCFPEGISYEEDHLFFLETLICDKSCKIYQSDIEFYVYRKRTGSATKTPSLNQVRDILYVVYEEQKLISKYGLTGNVKEALLKYICASFYQLTSIYGRLKKEDRRHAVKLIPFWAKWNCIWHSYDMHQKIKVFLFTFARWFVDWAYKRRGL